MPQNPTVGGPAFQPMSPQKRPPLFGPGSSVNKVPLPPPTVSGPEIHNMFVIGSAGGGRTNAAVPPPPSPSSIPAARTTSVSPETPDRVKGANAEGDEPSSPHTPSFIFGGHGEEEVHTDMEEDDAGAAGQVQEEPISFSLGKPDGPQVTPTKGSGRTAGRHKIRGAGGVGTSPLAGAADRGKGRKPEAKDGQGQHKETSPSSPSAVPPAGLFQGFVSAPGSAVPPPYDTQKELQHSAQQFREKVRMASLRI